MIRDVSVDELQEVLNSIWQLGGSLEWGNEEFDLRKAAVAATIAQVAYFAIGDDEREQSLRGKMVPSEIWQALIRQNLTVDLHVLARRADFPETHTIRTAAFVAVLIKLRDVMLIGIRGTQFAYDWKINFAVNKVGGNVKAGNFFHKGFYEEGRLMAAKIHRYLALNQARDWPNIYLCGHSLGGAVSAAIRDIGIQSYAHQSWSKTHSAYLFGAPRLAGDIARYKFVAYAVRRTGDLVPHLPPKALGYCDYVEQFSPRGLDWRADDGTRRWSLFRSPSRFRDAVIFREHAIEKYREDLLSVIAP